MNEATNAEAGLVLGYQQVLLQGAWPPPAVWGVSLGWLVVLAVVLNVLLKRSRDELVDWL